MKSPRRPMAADQAPIFNLLRAAIAGELGRDDIEVVTAASPLELAISTFAPSELMPNFEVSDYPFIGARYISVADGQVYFLFGPSDDGQELVCYRLSFWRSVFTTRGGDAVQVSEKAWMRSRMIMFSLTHAGMNFQDGSLVGIGDSETRRSFPMKKLRARVMYLRSVVRGWFGRP